MKLLNRFLKPTDSSWAPVHEAARNTTEFSKNRPWKNANLEELTYNWRNQLRGESNDPGSTSGLLPETFAAVIEACHRLWQKAYTVLDKPAVWDMIPYPEQILCGAALHAGMVAEMATGEGKTLAAVMPAYLNALLGKPVVIVTANDYLARRDSQWMTPVYAALGLKVGYAIAGQPTAEKRSAYAGDVIYTTASELAFDYLRDNSLTRSIEQKVIRRWPSLVVADEADHILLDEAKTPFVLSTNEGHDPIVMEFKADYNGRVLQLIHAQNALVDRIVHRIEQRIQDSNRHDSLLASDLFLIHAGAPTSPRLAGLLRHKRMVELLARERKRYGSGRDKQGLAFLKEQLYFTFDERDGGVTITDQGVKILSPNDPDFLTVPDVASQIQTLDQARLSLEERQAKAEEIYQHNQRRLGQIAFVRNLLKAHCYYQKDTHYIVQHGAVILVDQQTGRPLPNRRLPQGQHAALEVKEGVEVQPEISITGMITTQKLFRLFPKIAGMTGTAKTDELELKETYGMGVMVIPTHVPCIRQVLQDSVFRSKPDKLTAILNEVISHHKKGQPILIGTPSVESSEEISALLRHHQLAHVVLNAKHHDQEAKIIEAAGHKGSITLAANMAGRGTDIRLGLGVRELGGLHILGVERNSFRRLDQQLSGRCARQGDPGSVHFFASFEDDLLRLFGSPLLLKILSMMGMNNVEIHHPWLDKAITEAQKSVERQNYELRQKTRDLDEILAPQRNEVYTFRDQILAGKTEEAVETWTRFVADEIITQGIKDGNLGHVQRQLESAFGLPFGASGSSFEELQAHAADTAWSWYKNHQPEQAGEIILMCLDADWSRYVTFAMQTQQRYTHGDVDEAVTAFRKETFQKYQEFKNQVGRKACAAIYRVAHLQASKRVQ